MKMLDSQGKTPGRALAAGVMSACLGVALLGSGCETASGHYALHPEFSGRIEGVSQPLVLPPDVKIYELSAGGVTGEQAEWSALAKSHFQKYLDELDWESRPSRLVAAEELENQAEMKEMLDLAQIVGMSAALVTSPVTGTGFTHKRTDFRYSVGNCGEILDDLGGDALVIVTATDQYETSGRQALQLLGLAATIATGVAIMPAGGVGTVTLMVVDREGQVLWHSYRVFGQDKDFRNEAHVRQVLDAFMEDLRRSGVAR